MTDRAPTIEAAIFGALGCTETKWYDAASKQIARFVRESEEYQRLLQIEAAATAWRNSLECDDWTVHMIEQNVTSPGMSALLKLVRADGEEAVIAKETK